MAGHEKTVEELLYEALETRSPPVHFTAEALEAKADRLMQRYAEMRLAAALRQRIAGAVALLDPARRGGWLDRLAASLRIVVGAAPSSSSIEVGSGELWRFAESTAGTVRGAAGEARLDAALPDGATAVIIVDDLGETRRILATIRKFPKAEPAPVMLLIGADGAPIEIDPEIALDRSGDTSTLRYEALVPPGEVAVCWGNPR